MRGGLGDHFALGGLEPDEFEEQMRGGVRHTSTAQDLNQLFEDLPARSRPARGGAVIRAIQRQTQFPPRRVRTRRAGCPASLPPSRLPGVTQARSRRTAAQAPAGYPQAATQ